MKNNLLGAGLLLACGALLIGGQRKRRKGWQADMPNGKQGKRNTLIYVVEDIVRSVKWYNDFFAENEKAIYKDNDGTELKFPYALYRFKGIKIYLTTDPEYRKLALPIYYWTIPTEGQIEEADEAEAIGKAPASDSFADIRSRFLIRPVINAEVRDPSGNRIGITNNPIYVPTK
ncbi:hypothetical protein GCM10022408_27980 [Hymenobacter fastidiosus]|uniref:VOC family protein n=1 Tax=Hymenobacter fastidiosus TaxID=486264 RepID=A0ABP7SLF1_9BACT